MMDNDVSDTPELSRGGGPQSVPSRIAVVLVDEANAGGTPGRECLCEDQDIRPLAGVTKPACVTVYDDGIRSPCVEGTLSSSDVAGRLLPVGVADAPALSGGGPQSVPSRISVVLVDGTRAGGTPRRECSREDLRPLAGVTRPAGVTVCDDGIGCCREAPSGRAYWGSCPVGPMYPAGPDGPIIAGGPVGPGGTLSPFIHEVLKPLEHSVLDHAGPAGRHVAIGPVGPFGMLSPSDCHPAGPAVAGGPVGPDGTLSPFIHKVLEPLEHSVLDVALDGRPMEGISVLEPLEHSVLEVVRAFGSEQD